GQEARGIKLTAIEERLGEAQIIGGGRDRAGPAGVVTGLFGDGEEFDRLTARRVGSEWLGDTTQVARPYPEAGVVHLQRLEQALIKKFGETLTGYCLDDAAEQVHRQAGFPDGAGVVGGGGVGQAVDLLVRLYVALVATG